MYSTNNAHSSSESFPCKLAFQTCSFSFSMKFVLIQMQYFNESKISNSTAINIFEFLEDTNYLLIKLWICTFLLYSKNTFYEYSIKGQSVLSIFVYIFCNGNSTYDLLPYLRTLANIIFHHAKDAHSKKSKSRASLVVHKQTSFLNTKSIPSCLFHELSYSLGIHCTSVKPKYWFPIPQILKVANISHK